MFHRLFGRSRFNAHAQVVPEDGSDTKSSQGIEGAWQSEQAEDGTELDPKLEVDLHSLMFLCALQEFYTHLNGHAKIMSPNLITLVVYLLSIMSTLIQSYFVLSLYSWNDWEALETAVFSSGDVQELSVERLLGSLLLYFFVMPEAITALRTMLVWLFLSSKNFDTRSMDAEEKSRGWFVYPMRVVVLAVYLVKLVMSIATGVLAVSICYSTPDEEGAQGILMDFTGLLIIIEIDNIMVPFATEVAELVGCIGNVSLESVAANFIDNDFKIKFTSCQRMRRADRAMRWTILCFVGLTSFCIIALIVFEGIHLGKCHVDDFSSWTGAFMTMAAEFCPKTHPEPGTRCLNYDLYSKCSPTSSFCEHLLDGRIDERTIFPELTQCY